MKKIIIVFTGGTIAMRIDEKTHAAVPAINGEQILQMTPGIGRIAEIDFLNFSKSTQSSPLPPQCHAGFL